MINIRPATTKDIPIIAPMGVRCVDLHETFGEVFKNKEDMLPDTIKWFEEVISSPKQQLLIAEINNQIAGYIVIRLRKRPEEFVSRVWGFIEDLYVDSNYRTRGVGKELVKESLKWFKEKKITYIDLEVAKKNNIGEKFWSELGFEPYFQQMVKKI